MGPPADGGRLGRGIVRNGPSATCSGQPCRARVGQEAAEDTLDGVAGGLVSEDRVQQIALNPDFPDGLIVMA